MAFFPGTPKLESQNCPEIVPVGVSGLWELITPDCRVGSRQGLNQSCSPHRDLSNSISQSQLGGREEDDSRLLVVGSQTASLTPDHKKSGIDLRYLAAEGVQHTVGKISTRATTLLQITSTSEVCSQSYGAPKSRESSLARFRDSHSEVLGEKSHLDVDPVERCRVYYKGEGGGFPQVRAVVSLMCPCPCCLWLVLAPKMLQLCTNHFVLVLCRPV